jgi:hypothetical protein
VIVFSCRSLCHCHSTNSCSFTVQLSN